MREDRLFSALRVALIYALFGVAWMLIANHFILAIADDKLEIASLQNLKDWGFIIGSAVLIFFLLRREFHQFRHLKLAQEESERTLLALMGDLPGMTYRRQVDPSWSMDFVSEGCKELTGYEPSALIRDESIAYYDLIYPEDRDSLWGSVEISLEQNRPYQLVYRIKTAEGVEKWVLEQGQGVYCPEGELICLGGFITDVTERIEAEQEVRRRVRQQEAFNEIVAISSRATDLSQLLRSVLQNTLMAFKLQKGVIWVLDYVEMQGFQDTTVQFLVETLTFLMGEEKEIITLSSQDSPRGNSNLLDIQKSLSQSGIQSSLTIPILSEGRFIGGLCLANEQVREWDAEEIELGRVIGSQLGGAAERLILLGTIQEQAHLLQRILDTVREGIFTLDSERRILVANPSARVYLEQIAGVGPGEILERLGGRSFEEFLTPREDGLPHEIEINDEEARVFEIYPNPVEVDRERAGWTILVREVTEVREVQRRVQEQIRRGAVGQLAAGIAHDFNNIVAAIILYSEMVLGLPELPTKGRQRMNTIIDQAHRAASLTRQILDFSRRGILEPHPLDLIPFMKELIKLLERTLPENIRIRFDYEDDHYVVNTDPARIQQVFMNLAVNARDAMPSGGVLTFTLSVVNLEKGDPPPLHDMPSGMWVQISVSDTGEGIREEDLSKVFEPFFTTKSPGEGTGLGLAQVFGIVKQHEGFIGVSSELGKGTTFDLYLPALSVAALTGIIAEEAEPRAGKMETILVVEDDDAMREALVEMLKLLNYVALYAKDGREALEIFESEPTIDLVLSDLVMPEMGGVALYSILKEKFPDVKMVVMTGYPLAEKGKDLLEQGIVAWLQKPLDSDTLARTLQRVLSHKAPIEDHSERTSTQTKRKEYPQT
jgi:PAS domain S-box-containing protein